jgi:hypothetical protein
MIFGPTRKVKNENASVGVTSKEYGISGRQIPFAGKEKAGKVLFLDGDGKAISEN